MDMSFYSCLLLISDSSLDLFMMKRLDETPLTSNRSNVPVYIGAAGDTIQFVCVYKVASCGPYQSVEWVQNGVALTDTEIAVQDEKISTMQIVTLSRDMDGDMITCRFPDLSVQRSVTLSVAGKY